MKYLTIFYLFLFITHITLGPYYITYLLQFKKPKWASKNITEVLKRTLWITYISFLTIALFNEYPNLETYLIAFIISFISTVGYHYKFKDSPVYQKGIIDHIIYLVLPIIYLFFYYKIYLMKYKPTYLSLIATLYIFSYKYIDQLLYKTGKDM